MEFSLPSTESKTVLLFNYNVNNSAHDREKRTAWIQFDSV